MRGLSRGALARVLQSLLTAELKACRGGAMSGDGTRELAANAWPESVAILGGEDGALGVDSLEALRLGAAANEMFHLYESGSETGLLRARTFGDWLDIVAESWRSGVSRVTFSTSGTTGTPKRCTHAVAYLGTEIDFLAEMFADRRRIVSLVGAHHIYGFLWTALLPDRLGVEVMEVAGELAGGFLPKMCRGDLIVAVPEQWHWLDRSVPSWPEGVDGVVSTAPCPRGLIASLMERGLGRMTEIYGSSETAGVATRRWPEETYRLMPQWQLGECDGMGQVVLTHASGVRMEMMDRVTVRGSAGFVVEGRRDRAVQVGGTNVYPERVAACLRRVPGVADVAVRMMRPQEGMRLKAFVVPRDGASCEQVERELADWMKTKLALPERPKSIIFGAALPVNEMGKACDW